MKARLDLKTPERMFKDFEYWQTEIMKADLDGEHHQIEIPDVERIVELNEKKQQIELFLESLMRNNKYLILKFKRAVVHCISLIATEKALLR